MTDPRVVDDRLVTLQHAWDAGYVLAVLAAAGLAVHPRLDEGGRPTAGIELDDPRSTLVYVLTVQAT